MTFNSAPPQDWYESTIDQFYDGGLGTIHVKDVPLITFPTGKKVYITIDAKKTTMQVVEVDGWDSTAKTMNVSSITTERGDGLAYTAQDHGIGASVQISDPYEVRKNIEDAIGNIDSGTVKTNSQDIADGKFADPTARDAYFTSPVNGNSAYVTSLGLWTDYIAGAWTNRATGSTPNATDTSSGKVRLADQTQVNAGTDTEGGDPLVVIPSTLKVITDALASSLATQVAINNRRFGTGADGAQTGALTITGSNNTYILKQYTSFTPGANTVTITPTNCILHIKVQGNVDLTGTTFNFAGKGGPGGGGGSDAAANPGGNGGDGIASLGKIVGGKGGNNTLPIYAGAVTFFGNDMNPFIKAACGSGGGGGASDGIGSGGGGSGGNGGGCVIIECGGNLTFSSTTYTFNGTVGSDKPGVGDGGGGGGGGGCVITLYRGTLTGTPTVNVAGGAGGAGGGTASGNGGSSIAGIGAVASLNGGAGANGVSVLQQI